MLNRLMIELRKLNTITKYPSILTYHELGARGTVIEELTSQNHKLCSEEILEGTEKVDGTNARIVICGSDYLIGTREEFIYAKGDRIINDKESILLNCIPIAERIISENTLSNNELLVIYGEAYGKSIGRGCKNYANKDTAFRVFDMWSMNVDKIEELLNTDLEKLATWREHGNQPYFKIEDLKYYCDLYKLEKTPVLFSINQKDFPTSIKEVYDFLLQFKNTKVALDLDITVDLENMGKSEGFVVRNSDRSYIKKIRFEEYEKTLKVK